MLIYGQPYCIGQRMGERAYECSGLVTTYANIDLGMTWAGSLLVRNCSRGRTVHLDRAISGGTVVSFQPVPR